MPRRRRRYYGVRSVARTVARAPVERDSTHPGHYLPPGLCPEARKRFRAVLRRDEQRYRKALKRRLTDGELDVVRRQAVQRLVRERITGYQAQANRAAKAAEPPKPAKHRPDLMFGRGQGGSGSTGLGGRISSRRARSGPRKFRLLKPKWIDPYPWIPGTVPEKMIFDVLVRRRIFFIFHGTPDDFDGNDALTFYAPTLHDFDFVIPEYKVVIDPFSEFHHAQADSVRRDTLRAVVLYSMGWAYYHPWAHEVEANAIGVVDSIPEFGKPPVAKLSEKDQRAKAAQGYRLGAALGTGAFAVGIANRKRRRAPSLRLG